VIQKHFIEKHQFYTGVLSGPYWDFQNPSFQTIQKDMESKCKNPDPSGPSQKAGDASTPAAEATTTVIPSTQSTPTQASSGGGCSLDPTVPAGNTWAVLMTIPFVGLGLIRKRK
jgi:hypothetical protein